MCERTRREPCACIGACTRGRGVEDRILTHAGTCREITCTGVALPILRTGSTAVAGVVAHRSRNGAGRTDSTDRACVGDTELRVAGAILVAVAATGRGYALVVHADAERARLRSARTDPR